MSSPPTAPLNAKPVHPNWCVNRLSVSTTTADGVTDTLYANGEMQVLVNVTIEAYDGTLDMKPYQLTDDELNSIVLIDYNNPTEKLGGQWKYTSAMFGNIWSQVIGGGGGLVDGSSDTGSTGSPVAANASGPQTVGWWVQTYAIGSQKIGAAITQPDGTYYSTNSAEASSGVTLTGESPLLCDTSTAQFIPDEAPVATGTIRLNWNVPNGETYSDFQWSAQNFQLVLQQGAIKMADTSNYIHDEYNNTKGPGEDNSFSLRPFGICGTSINIWYMWPLGKQTNEDVGPIPGGQSRNFTASPATVSIPVNNRPGALCITRLQLTASSDLINGYLLAPMMDNTADWGPNFWGNAVNRHAHAKVYDQWGNNGWMTIGLQADGPTQSPLLLDGKVPTTGS